jgi:hypothetical protein
VDINRYAYALNDPVNLSDPNGHKVGNPDGKEQQEARAREAAEQRKKEAEQRKREQEADDLAKKIGINMNSAEKLREIADPTIRAMVEARLNKLDAINDASGVLYSGAAGVGGIVRGVVGRGAQAALSKAEQLAVNAKRGAAFEAKVEKDLLKRGFEVGKQVTVKTKSGTTTRIDIITRNPADGTIRCVECKSSSSAPMTVNQATAFPQIQSTGGTIAGSGKPGFPGGSRIPPTTVEVIRP